MEKACERAIRQYGLFSFHLAMQILLWTLLAKMALSAGPDALIWDYWTEANSR